MLIGIKERRLHCAYRFCMCEPRSMQIRERAAGANVPSWEHFAHDADIGVRGWGATPDQAFVQAALAMTAVVTDLKLVKLTDTVAVECQASSLDLLLYRWLNALVFEMATRGLLFGAFEVSIEGTRLMGVARGEKVDRVRHAPAVEVKGATLTELAVVERRPGFWLAQCVVDV
ncbi:MAG TPA: archease [Hyphomicrobiaceae bacterium]|nr:archease [Hyphomicrobiaceae bacterium]